MADVYTNTDSDNFPGARERTRPGTAPGETIHETVLDPAGNPVSNKPANITLLRQQKARLEYDKLRKAGAAGSGSGSSNSSNSSTSSSGSGSIWSKLILLAIFLPLLSHFLVGNYHFSQAPTVRKLAKAAWTHPSNPWGPKLITLTSAQLANYDGSDPAKPIYLAVRGEVFDVSANPRMYGKGGAYNMMAGRDASRAFVTGCFETHLTHDLRGLSDAELKSLDGWLSFFKNSDKYFKVGNVVLPPIKPNSPIPKPCVPGGDEAPAHHKQGRGHGGGAQGGGNSPNPHAKGKQ